MYTPVSVSHLMLTLDPMIYTIRKQLQNIYCTNIAGTTYYNYKGLCDEAIGRLSKEIRIYNEVYNTNYTIQVIHGEQKHSSIIPSKYWGYQHTWCSVSTGDYKVYVDPTSCQFKDLYDDIPDYYMAIEKPKWYYADRDNIRYKFGYSFLGDIIEVLQYKVWAKVSDLMHKFVRRR